VGSTGEIIGSILTERFFLWGEGEGKREEGTKKSQWVGDVDIYIVQRTNRSGNELLQFKDSLEVVM